ncbi:TKL protein kinase [Saprolegnia parasitica CBS 223.65]|uniref:TKL protein kinase n=1 Tax=Saprolegnia parasitica (strain CBS 223.65) TaxID=695850 RepID=A0A067CD64_SAPPC|nr:TKL protein kinase [Saprolegnia parasitica CBS 223.65]KDO28448.1 TKL protein kinase [Saprolegnia parasitica CBS 223.65]|eukprot:XP_012200888.1 TKL protein kinase [Saprolegnia parasitica CBS 223.65]
MRLVVTCQLCNEDNAPTASLCAHCDEEMPPAENRLKFVRVCKEDAAAHNMLQVAKKELEDANEKLAAQVNALNAKVATMEKAMAIGGSATADPDFRAAYQRLDAEYEAKSKALEEERMKLQQDRANELTLQSTPLVNVSDVHVVDEQPLWRGEVFILHKVRINDQIVVRKSLDPNAVEALRRTGKLAEMLDKVKRSFAILRRLNGGRGSLIQILGASGLDYTSENPVIYMPYMPRGSLRYLIEKTPDAAAVPWPTRLDVAFTIARGLYELHAIDRIHRDVNSFHVLVHDLHRVVLTGFSHVRQPSAGTMTGNVGDVRWAAPETLQLAHARYSVKADIFSFGKLLEELATHALPYVSFINETTSKPISEHALEKRLANVTAGDPILQHNMDASTPAYYAEIVQQCLALEPSSRPTILTILETLRREVEKFLFPLQPPVTEPMHVQVEVQRAKGLRGTGTRHMQVQCHVSLGRDQSQTGFSEERGSSPTWNHLMDFRPQEPEFMTLEARVYQKLGNQLAQICICTVPLQKTLPHGDDLTDDDWVVELEAPLFKDGADCGELYLKVTFMGEGRLRWRNQYFDRVRYIDDSIRIERDPVRVAQAKVIRSMYMPT